MTTKSFRALCVVIATTALVLVPSSLSASDSRAAEQAAAGDALEVALAYVNANPADLGVTSADVSDLYATSTLKRSLGVTHVNLNQRFQDLEVFGGHSTVSVKNGSVVFAAGAFVRNLRAAGPRPRRSTPSRPSTRPRGTRPGGARQPPRARGRRRRGRRLGRRDLGYPDSSPVGLGLHEGRPSPGVAAFDRRLGQRVPLERDHRRDDGRSSESTTGPARTTWGTWRQRCRAPAALPR